MGKRTRNLVSQEDEAFVEDLKIELALEWWNALPPSGSYRSKKHFSHKHYRKDPSSLLNTEISDIWLEEECIPKVHMIKDFPIKDDFW